MHQRVSFCRRAGCATATLTARRAVFADLHTVAMGAAGGVLPYMVLLHRPSRSVVLAIRGTGGLGRERRDQLMDPLLRNLARVAGI